MPLNTEILPVLLFVIVNFMIIFLIKNEINQAISLIFSYFLVVAFFSLVDTNYDNLQEIILILSCYLIVILFIIFNHESAIIDNVKPLTKFRQFFVIPALVFGFITIFLTTIWITENISKISNSIETKKIEKKNQKLFAHLKSVTTNNDEPLELMSQATIDQLKIITPTAPSTNDVPLYKEQKEFNMSGRRRVYLKEKLSENFLLKHSSELILLILSFPLISIVLTRKEQ